jgi:L-alanine-DL-glutamate epimerase-like enolase superfamily enzyme
MRSFPDSDFDIIELRTWAIDIPLTDHFTISQGSLSVAENAFVQVTLRCGVVGYGESAPFPGLTPEDRDGSLRAIEHLKEVVHGQSAARLRQLSRQMAGGRPGNPAARCGLETAILDAFCRALGIPMWAYFGGASTGPFETDITLPMLGIKRCLELADHWYRRGFRILKVKVGSNVDSDIGVIHDISARFPDTSFVVDANQGFSEHDALLLMQALKGSNVTVRMIEQPVHKTDIEALARLRREKIFPICADESVGSRQDAAEIVRAGAADIINIKIMKCGVVEAFDIALYSLTAGLQIMFGGMMETRLAMGCSLAMAAGIGQAHTLDLDTPLLMAADPLEGGYRYEGPRMSLAEGAGMGITLRSLGVH